MDNKEAFFSSRYIKEFFVFFNNSWANGNWAHADGKFCLLFGNFAAGPLNIFVSWNVSSASSSLIKFFDAPESAFNTGVKGECITLDIEAIELSDECVKVVFK